MKETFTFEPFETVWQSPSNIALVKYWGKHGRQLPRNPSISFTLKNSVTTCRALCSPKQKQNQRSESKMGIDFKFEFDGKQEEGFQQRIARQLEEVVEFFPFLTKVQLEIFTQNTFPHSAGIASSASSMSALALCLCSIEEKLKFTSEKDDFFKRASFISRLFSGSACRSVYGDLVAWGEHSSIDGSSDQVAVPLAGRHEVFFDFQDTILIVDSQKKAVSSSKGHGLMENHPFAPIRFEQARNNIIKLKEALVTGNLGLFGEVVEAEALELHALMMTSTPSYTLMRPGTLKIIELIRSFRQSTGHSLYFTLDAGPNVHLLYPKKVDKEVRNFIEDQLLPHTEERKVIYDEVGRGPVSM